MSYRTWSETLFYICGACLLVFSLECLGFLYSCMEVGRVVHIPGCPYGQVGWEEKGSGALHVFDLAPLPLALDFSPAFSLLSVLELRVSLVQSPQRVNHLGWLSDCIDLRARIWVSNCFLNILTLNSLVFSSTPYLLLLEVLSAFNP